LGSNVKFQFILPDELQAQVARRAGKEAVGKPKRKAKLQHRDQSESVVLDPTKLTIPEGSFIGGGKNVLQRPCYMATSRTIPSIMLAQGPLAMLVLHGPVSGCPTSLSTQKVAVPARCSVTNGPLLLEAFLVQLGGTPVSRAVSQPPVPIDTVKVSTLKLVLFKDECWQPWEEVTAAPTRYIIQNIFVEIAQTAGLDMPTLA